MGDFAGWFEAYIGGHWRTFDPRNNVPRIGRVLIAQGRDASDVPITQTFGPNTLVSFKVWTDEYRDAGFSRVKPLKGNQMKTILAVLALAHSRRALLPRRQSAT